MSMASDYFEHMNPRQLAVVEMIAKGMRNSEIAQATGYTYDSIPAIIWRINKGVGFHHTAKGNYRVRLVLEYLKWKGRLT